MDRAPTESKLGAVRLAAVLACAFVLTFAGLLLLTPTATANPFEPVAMGSYAYDVIRELDGRGLGSRYVEERVQAGETITYFDLAIWVGEVVEALRAEYAETRGDKARVSAPLSTLIENYNARHPSVTIEPDLERALARLESDVASYLEILGYTLSRKELATRSEGRPAGLARILEDLRSQGGGTLRYNSVRADGNEVRPFRDLRHSGEAEEGYTLEVVGEVSPTVRPGAGAGSEYAPRGGKGASFALNSSAPVVGSGSGGLTRTRDLSGQGLSELAIGDTRGLLALQAGLHIETFGSTIVVGRHDESTGRHPFNEAGVERLLTAWDGSLPLSERLTLGATLAHLSTASSDRTAGGTSAGDNTVVRLGGTYALLPQLIISGEMARSAEVDGGGEAVKIGAVLHPLPELTLGASLLTADSGYRPIFGGESSPISRIDLSAEVGRWILSLRRQYLRADGSGIGGNVPLSEREGERVDDEKEPSPSMSGSRSREGNSQTEVDLELRLDQGRVSLGYVLEDVSSRAGMGAATSVRVARATVEHAVGPIGTATAGFTIIDLGERSESSSNLGLRYEFEDASVSLRYEIFTKAGDERENVTTAELSIKF